MKNPNNWLVALLVLIGLTVGGMSLYMASLSGVMAKMGLVGGDFRQAIDRNELARQLRGRDEVVDCGIWQVAKQVPSYLIAKGENRVNLGGKLGEERVICGIRLVQSGNVERGVYTLIKGLYYLDSQYREMRPLVERDSTKCQLLTKTEYESWVQGYLQATQGRVHDIVYDLYKRVERERSRVEELCVD
jgi:hypothetical protein